MSVTDVTDTSAIQPLINQFDDYIKYDNEYNHSHEYKHFHHPTIAELDHFKKSWFYDDWCVRFRKLNAFNALGTKGVIALPNTTFEEWLYWFQEWAIAWMDDYNQFKKMVYEALQLIEKHLEAIDKTLEDHEKRIEKIEDEIKDIYNKIQDIYNKIKQLQGEIDKINNEIQDIYNKINNLQNQINDLRNQVNQNTQDIKNLANKEQQDVDRLQKEIDDILKQLHNNIAPNWLNASDEGAGAVNGWAVDKNSNPHGFNVQYRWINQDDHSQGLYLNINYNHVYNDSYSPGTKDTIMQVDLTNFVNQTHAIIPQQQWPSSTGSYYTNKQRSGFGLHWTYDSSSHIMTINLDYRDGVYAVDVWPDKITLINGSTSVYCPVSQS